MSAVILLFVFGWYIYKRRAAGKRKQFLFYSYFAFVMLIIFFFEIRISSAYFFNTFKGVANPGIIPLGFNTFLFVQWELKERKKETTLFVIVSKNNFIFFKSLPKVSLF